MAPPHDYKIRVRPDTEWPLLWESSLQSVLFPSEEWATFKKPEETLEMSLAEVIDRAQQYFNLDAMHAKALQQKITKLFRTTITTEEHKTVEEPHTTSGGISYTETVYKTVTRHFAVSKDGVLDTFDEFRFVGDALVAIEQDVLEDFAKRSADPAAWKAAPASVATTIVNVVKFVGYRRDDQCTDQCDRLQTALKSIDFRPLLQDDVLKQWLTYATPDSTNPSVLIDLLQTRYSSTDLDGFMKDIALDPAFLAQLFVTLLQRFPDQVPNQMIAAAILTVDENHEGVTALRDALYAGKGSPLIERYLAKTPNPSAQIVTALARAGHPTGYRFVREILTNPSSRYLQSLRKEGLLGWHERLGELIGELANPKLPEEYELEKIHPDRRADYLAMRKDVQQRIRTAAQHYDAHSGFVLNLLVNGEGGIGIFSELEAQWKAADPKYQPCTFHQLKAYAASFPVPADDDSINNLLDVFYLLTRTGYPQALDRLKELALTFDRVAPYALQKLYVSMEPYQPGEEGESQPIPSEILAQPESASAKMYLQVHNEHLANASSSWNRAIIQFFAQEIPAEPMAKFVLETIATRAEKDPEALDLFVLFDTLVSQEIERTFPVSYHVLRNVTLQLRDADRAKVAAETFGVMDAQDRYADLGDARPLAVLQQLVVTGHVAADTAWQQIKNNTKVPNETYVGAMDPNTLLPMLAKIMAENKNPPDLLVLYKYKLHWEDLVATGAVPPSILDEPHKTIPAAVSEEDSYAVMVDHLFAILDIAQATRVANVHQLDAIEFLVDLVHGGQIQALSDADGAELVMQLRNLNVASLAAPLDAPETHTRVLGVLTKLADLGNASAWDVIQTAFTQQPETYAATLQQFLEDDNFPFHSDIISLAQAHVQAESVQASLYRECYNLLITAAQADRDGAWTAIGALATEEVGMTSPAVDTLLGYTSAQFPDEQQGALADYDTALATLIQSQSAIVTDLLPELDPIVVQQAQQLADRECVASLNAVNEYEALRAALQDAEHAYEALEAAMQEIPGGGVLAVPASAAATSSSIGAGSTAPSASAIRQVARTLYAAGATPTDVAHALHTLKMQGMSGAPHISAAAAGQLVEAILAPAMAVETMNTALAILVELAVYQQPPVPAAQKQLSMLIDTCKQAVAHHADGSPDFWLSLLQRTVELGQGQPVAAVNALVDLMHSRSDLRGIIGNILAYLHVQIGVHIPATVQ